MGLKHFSVYARVLEKRLRKMKRFGTFALKSSKKEKMRSKKNSVFVFL
jgi:hypothetical protein